MTDDDFGPFEGELEPLPITMPGDDGAEAEFARMVRRISWERLECQRRERERMLGI